MGITQSRSSRNGPETSKDTTFTIGVKLREAESGGKKEKRDREAEISARDREMSFSQTVTDIN
jgi:hypothetical protein